ncbi:regucalcin isoform X1 [Lucilia sericata]|uniref:regucalcin isoform X1 n=2 Tax=Lucilia sericata TaxID=13632 RepID=UPI0018A8218E|nr:regucalcin isoform X1 [Lucilia sericata]
MKMLTQSFKLCFVVLLSSIFGIRETYGNGHKEVSMEVNITNSSVNKTMSYKVEEIQGSLADMGEGPHWDVASQNLYYVDINAGKILRYSYKENKVYKAKVEGEEYASYIIPVEGTSDQFAVGCGRRCLVVRWDGVSPTAKPISTLFEVQMGNDRNESIRLNDGKCDSKGRLFAGTMRHVGDLYEHRWGELYKYEKGGKIDIIKSDVGISNGLTWNDKLKKFYFADTADFEVKEYDYDVNTGQININKPKITLDFRKNTTKNHLLPDGMTIDTEGNIYVATFNGYAVYKINPSTGKILLEIKIPCLHVTSVAFGGPNLDILFVTTANEGDLPPPCGSVFKVTGLGVKGYPMTNVKI